MIVNRPAQRAILVYADWHGLGASTLMGTLSALSTRGREVFAFEYDRTWLQADHHLELDPQLGLFSGRQFARVDRASFGLFLDSSPDRWGKLLLERREGRDARREGREPHHLTTSDYLLGVHDLHRPGALRFRLKAEGNFLDDRTDLVAPPLASLRELEAAAMALDSELDVAGDHHLHHHEHDRWLSMLIAPGASLGGARPKASVFDEHGAPWIAKFPSTRDRGDSGGWEMVVHRLAELAKVEVAEARVQRLGSTHYTFITRRFDRIAGGRRIHFASAMTLLGRNDGDDAAAGASYVEFVELLRRSGARTKADLAQLWRRIAFFVCVSNTDDHLRNHGFLLEPGAGWRLAPAFDMNPVADGDGLHLNIDEHDNSQDLDLVRSMSDIFGLGKGEREQVLLEVITAVRRWRAVAVELGLSKREQDRMVRAFRVAGT